MNDKLLQKYLSTLTETDEDSICIGDAIVPVTADKFHLLEKKSADRFVFTDGGSAAILKSPQACLFYVKIAAVVYGGSKKVDMYESWCISTLKYEDKLVFEVESDLVPAFTIPAEDMEHEAVIDIARRCMELEVASRYDNVVLDGSFLNMKDIELKYFQKLKPDAIALSKTSSFISHKGKSPSQILNAKSPNKTWVFDIGNIDGLQFYFTKLNAYGRHIFKVESVSPVPIEIFERLMSLSNDGVFPGYPYGLIEADMHARLSNQEKESLRIQALVKSGNAEKIRECESSCDAHSILDNIRF